MSSSGSGKLQHVQGLMNITFTDQRHGNTSESVDAEDGAEAARGQAGRKRSRLESLQPEDGAAAEAESAAPDADMPDDDPPLGGGDPDDDEYIDFSGAHLDPSYKDDIRAQIKTVATFRKTRTAGSKNSWTDEETRELVRLHAAAVKQGVANIWAGILFAGWQIFKVNFRTSVDLKDRWRVLCRDPAAASGGGAARKVDHTVDPAPVSVQQKAAREEAAQAWFTDRQEVARQARAEAQAALAAEEQRKRAEDAARRAKEAERAVRSPRPPPAARSAAASGAVAAAAAPPLHSPAAAAGGRPYLATMPALGVSQDSLFRMTVEAEDKARASYKARLEAAGGANPRAAQQQHAQQRDQPDAGAAAGEETQEVVLPGTSAAPGPA